MKNVSTTDLRAIAIEARSLAGAIDNQADEAVRRVRDWATPLRSSQGFGPKNEVSRPTENAALNYDPNRDEWALLTVDSGHCFDGMSSLRSRLRGITTDAVVENQRAGIGTCACGRYCTGIKDDRLRNLECPACYKRSQRKDAKTERCEHPSTTWSQGRKWCNQCHVDLDGATG